MDKPVGVPQPPWDVWLVPDMQTAIDVWRSARLRFLRDGGKENLDAFCAATNQLYLVFVRETEELPWVPKAFAEFRTKLINNEEED
jgi:hypothetical protein